KFELLQVYAISVKLEAVMKFAVITIVLTCALVWSQEVKSAGHPSKYANAGKNHGGSSATLPAPKTDSLAVQLAKIEQQGAHVSSSATSQSGASAKPVFAKTPATQNKNRPMKFTPKAQPTRAGQAH